MILKVLAKLRWATGGDSRKSTSPDWEIVEQYVKILAKNIKKHY